MKLTTKLLTAASTLALLPVAFSFEQGQGNQNLPSLDQLYPGAYGSANFGKVAAGEFTGNLVLDALVMDGTTLYLTCSPESFDNRITVQTAVNDFAVLSGVVSGKDLVVTVSGNGLQTHERMSSTGSWTVTTIRGPETAWLNATKVCTGDLNADGKEDLVGVAANSRDLLIEYGNGDGTFTSGTTTTVPNVTTIREILTLNYVQSGDVLGDDEIALSTNLGAAVFNPTNGTYPLVVSWTTSVLHIAAVKRIGSVTERLASVGFFNGQDRLVVRGVGGVVEPTVNLGNLGVVDVSSGDADNDGDSELFLSQTANRNLTMLTNSSGTSSFSSSAVTTFPYGHGQRDPALNDSNLALGDFDSDGYIDVLAPAQGGGTNPSFIYGTLEIVQLGIGDPDQYKPTVSQVTYIDREDPESSDKLRFRFERPDTVLDDQGGQLQLKLRVRVFLSDALCCSTDTAPYDDEHVLVPAVGDTVLYTMNLPGHIDAYYEHFTEAFTLIVCQELLDSSDNPVDRGPCMQGIYSSADNHEILTQVAGIKYSRLIDRIDTSIPPSGGFDVGPDVPPFDDELEPKDEPKPNS